MDDNQLRFGAAFASSPGKKRVLNEDSFLAQFPVFVVADGMGGHSAGDVASALVTEGLSPFIGRDDIAATEVIEALGQIQQAVTDLSDSTEGGAGSTVSGVVATRGAQGHAQWLVVNVGDSRTYRMLGEQLVRITRDHSVVQELLDDGSITELEAADHPESNVITKAIGDGESSPDFWVTPIVPGERILVVSDGALEGISDETLFELLKECPQRDQSASTLAELALANGGSDNITVVAVDVVGANPAEALPALTPLPIQEDEFVAETPALPDDTTVPAKSRRRT